MKWIATLIVVAASAVTALLVIGSDGNADSGERTIEVLESDKGSTFQGVDSPPETFPPAVTPGDVGVISMPLLDPGSEERIGTLHSPCTVMVGSKNLDRARVLCEGVVELEDGTLTISGLAGKYPIAAYAVTGGTGAYEGARGTYRQESGEPVSVIHLVE